MLRTNALRTGLLLVLVGCGPAAAATFVVTTFTDTPGAAAGCTSQLCSLRGAVSSANATPGADVIMLGSGDYILALTGAGENANLTGDLDISDDLTIQGLGQADTEIRWSTLQVDRLMQFSVSEPDRRLQLQGLTLRNGDSGGSQGGAIHTVGALRLTDVRLQDNVNTVGGAAITVSSVPAGALAAVEIPGSRFVNNDCTGLCAGALELVNVCGPIRVERSSFVQHNAGAGGAIWVGPCSGVAASDIAISDGLFGFNFAIRGGALLLDGSVQARIDRTLFDSNSAPSLDGGGAIRSLGATLDIRASTFHENHAFNLGGATLGSGGAISGTAPRLIEDSLFDSNLAGENGGALNFTNRVVPFTIRRTRFLGNETDAFGSDFQAAGGAIFLAYTNDDPTGLPDRIEKSHFELNIAPGSGEDDGGGAIHKRGNTPLRIEASSFVGNTTGGLGGAIHGYLCGTPLAGAQHIEVLNSTFASNTTYATPASAGGAIAATFCRFGLESVTFRANTATLGSAVRAGPTATDGGVRFRNTLISGACSFVAGSMNIDAGGNQESPGNTCLLTALSSQPLLPDFALLLGSLITSGTQYFLPASNSVVFNAGLSGAQCTPLDQRGVARIDGVCDVGATEPSNPEVFKDNFEG